VKEVIVGGRANVNPAKEAVPDGVVTLTLPDAPAPTTASMNDGVTTLKEATGTPPILTAVAPVKPEPKMAISVPAPVEGGKKLEICGIPTCGGATVTMTPARVAVPRDVVTEMLPDIELGFITAVICPSETTVNEVTATPPIVTAEVPANPVPKICTTVPAVTDVGVKEVMTGGAVTVMVPFVVPFIVPVVPPVIVLSFRTFAVVRGVSNSVEGVQASRANATKHTVRVRVKKCFTIEEMFDAGCIT
jgi:hypothetical protein